MLNRVYVPLLLLLFGLFHLSNSWSLSANTIPHSSHTDTEQLVFLPMLVVERTLDEIALDTELVLGPLDSHITDIVTKEGETYIVTKCGHVYTLSGTEIIDISGQVSCIEHLGLLGFAIEDDGDIYLSFVDTSKNSIVARWQDGALQTILSIPPLHSEVSTHVGGPLLFDEAGYLLLFLGDGQRNESPDNQPQELDSWWGKVLRIDVSPPTGYAIPTDNPFVDVAGAKPEIYALGLRHPWGVSFSSDSVLMADVGQHHWEEINWLAKGDFAGANFGWPCYEGFTVYNGCDLTVGHSITPIHVYPHDYTLPDYCRASATGGVLYQGAIPELRGQVIFGDWCQRMIWSWEGGQVYELLTDMPPSQFGVDAQQELLIGTNKRIYRLVDGTP